MPTAAAMPLALAVCVLVVAAIEDHSTQHGADTGPCVWSMTVDAVLDRVRGGGATPETGR